MATSHIDLLPTLMELAGGDAPPEARGLSLVPLLRGGGGGSGDGGANGGSDGDGDGDGDEDGTTPGVSPPQHQALPGVVPSSPLSARLGVAAEYHSNLGSTGAFGWITSDGEWKLVVFGHTLPWFAEAAGYVPQLFHLPTDPFEMDNVAAAHPQLVATLTAHLEATFGGRGALAAIDRAQMAENFALYKAYFADALPRREVLRRFQATFANVSAAEIAAHVEAWEAAMGAHADDGAAEGDANGSVTMAAAAISANGGQERVEWVGDVAEGTP